MIHTLTAYPAYKDSGVPWLGKVPAHWEVRRLRNTVETRISNVDKHSKEGEKPVRLCNYVDVYRHERIHSNMEFMKATASVEEIERFRLEKGDVLITKDSEVWDDIGVPALIESSAPDLITGYHLALLRPKQVVEGAFLLRALQSPQVAYQFYVEAKGVTRYGLSHGAIKSAVIPLPPLPDQNAIMRFLDWAELRIRRVIRARQRRIKLLDEYKRVLTHQVVTGKFNVRTGQPYPAYKPSGVEWLGRVPEYWEVRRLKTIVDHINKQTNTKNEEELYIALEHVESWSGRLLVSSREAHFTSAVKRFRTGDILFGKLRPYLAKVVQPKQNGVCVSEFLVLRARSVIAPEYLEVVLRSALAIDFINSSTYGAKMPRAEWTFVGSMLFPLPSLSEQTAIVEYLNGQTAKIDAAIAATRREIELLQEYRTRLIADVVTGKVDVREVATQLPDEPAEEAAELMEADEITEGEAENDAATEALSEEEVEP